MQMTGPTPKTLKQRWDELHAKKSTIINLCEEYASYTIPHLFPELGVETTELTVMNDPIGARGTNHLSNKIVSTLFRPNGPFFRLSLDDGAIEAVRGLMGPGNDVKLADAMNKIDEELSRTEKKAMQSLDMVAFRPSATNTAKLLIVTGNALEVHLKDMPVQVFNLRNYCVVRDLSGTVIEIMTKEDKAFETFSPAVQEQLRVTTAQQYTDTNNVSIYTQIKLMDDGKYHLKQAGDQIMLDSTAMWIKDELPYIVLTWNLIQGEDYGRGLVADYAGAFHALKVLHQSLLNLAAVIGDLKYLVNPASVIDVVSLNNAPPGSYHAGREGDVTAIQTNKNSDAQFIVSMIEKYERQIAEAFLLNSQVTRQAERVTAEEIRLQAQELETSNGGIYSRLAHTWQLPVANITLSNIGYKGLRDNNIRPQIITGMDSLSRQSEMDNIRMFIQDLAMLEAVPEDVRVQMDSKKFALLVGKNRQVDANQFFKTPEQIEQERQQAMELQAQQNQQAVQGQVAVEAGKQAVQGNQ